MVKILSWNMRGLNGLSKQKEIKLICNELEVDLIGLVETKIRYNRVSMIAEKLFEGWQYCTNRMAHYNVRIWVI